MLFSGIFHRAVVRPVGKRLGRDKATAVEVATARKCPSLVFAHELCNQGVVN